MPRIQRTKFETTRAFGRDMLPVHIRTRVSDRRSFGRGFNIDCGEKSVSAFYTYFDPDFSKLSLGTYSILKQIEFVKGLGAVCLFRDVCG